MQFKKQISLEDFKTEIKTKVREQAQQRYEKIVSDREAVEWCLKMIQRLAAGQQLTAAMTAKITAIQALRDAETTAVQSINTATTKAEIRTAWQIFKQ